MVDRQCLGDVGLAILLALPTAALARPSATIVQTKPAASAPHVQAAAQSPLGSRFGLPGRS